jgi:hypothetical protein
MGRKKKAEAEDGPLFASAWAEWMETVPDTDRLLVGSILRTSDLTTKAGLNQFFLQLLAALVEGRIHPMVVAAARPLLPGGARHRLPHRVALLRLGLQGAQLPGGDGLREQLLQRGRPRGLPRGLRLRRLRALRPGLLSDAHPDTDTARRRIGMGRRLPRGLRLEPSDGSMPSSLGGRPVPVEPRPD